MNKVEIDVIRLQVAALLIEKAIHILRRFAGPRRQLRREIYLLPVSVPQCMCHRHFVLLTGIHIRRVDVVYAVVDGVTDGRCGDRFVHKLAVVRFPHREAHTAIPERGHRDPQLFDLSHLHLSYPRILWWIFVLLYRISACFVKSQTHIFFILYKFFNNPLTAVLVVHFSCMCAEKRELFGTSNVLWYIRYNRRRLWGIRVFCVKRPACTFRANDLQSESFPMPCRRVYAKGG